MVSDKYVEIILALDLHQRDYQLNFVSLFSDYFKLFRKILDDTSINSLPQDIQYLLGYSEKDVNEIRYQQMACFPSPTEEDVRC